MKFFPWLQSRAAKNEKRDGLEVPGVGLSNLSAIWNFLDGGSRFNESDEMVNDSTALSISTVFTCCRVLGDAIASLPCRIYNQTPNGKQEDIDAPLSHLLQIEANPDTSAYSFFETLVTHLNLRGNAYAEIQRNGAGDVVALWNLDPRLTEPVRIGAQRDLAYKTRDGMLPGQPPRIIAAANMLHVVLFSWDGIVGVSPIAMLRQTLGLAISQQKFSARLTKNNAVPSLALMTTGKLKPEDKMKMRSDWQDLQTGSNQGSVAVLDQGLSVERLGLSAEDSELLASRSFSRSEIAAAFRVPASMVGDLTRLSNSNHEQQSLSFVTDSLSPLLKRIEIEFRRKLLPPSPIGKPNTSFIQFDIRDRLKSDFATTMQGFAVGKQWGFYSTNDVRKELGENPIGPEGDVYWAPSNMQNAELMLTTESVQDQPIGATPPAPPAAPAPDDAARQYLRLYRDAVGRLAARAADKRDLATVTQIFTPLLESIAELGAERAKRSTNAPEWQYSPAKPITDYLQKLTERAATWKPEDDLDTIAAQELQKVTKTLTLAAHRSVAEHVALSALSSLSTLKGLPNGA